MNTLRRIAFFLFLLVFVFSCKDKATEPVSQHLVSATVHDSYSKDDFKTFISSALGSASVQVTPFVQYGVERYKIIYKTTDIDGTEITASGALVIPIGINTPVSLASMQHGTLFDESDAPSYFNVNTEVAAGSFLGSLGIAVVMPDYIGYGESKNRPHPYEHKAGLAIPTVDLIKAAKEFLDSRNISWTRKVLLAGYSEGGYATMAACQHLEQHYKNNFPVAVCIPGAGAYNKTASFNLIMNEPSSGDINHNRSYIWVLQTYLRAKNINKPMSYFFKEPYAAEIESKGHLATVPVSLHQALQPEFVKDYNDGKLPEISGAIAENDIYNWKPSSKIRMYHGNADDYVPYLNSTTTLNAMKSLGASDVTLTTIQNGTHASSITSYFLGVLEGFFSNK
jgi:pimeloyl-ACP methyl ester carboxylesterase